MKLNLKILKAILEAMNFNIDDNIEDIKLSNLSSMEKAREIQIQAIYEYYLLNNKIEKFLEYHNLTNTKFIAKNKDILKLSIDGLYLHEYYNIDLNWIDTGNITDMSELFKGLTLFNCNISEWNVSNVEYMHDMFYNAVSFNLTIGNWDVGNVTDMGGMFCGAKSFDLPIGDWNVSNVKDMSFMFSVAKSFNLPIGDWDVSKVENMCDMFHYAEKFNLPIEDWDISNVKDMTWMFSSCPIKEEYKPKLK